MKKNEKFNNFCSLLESEVLDDKQMNMLEAGGSCESSCKKGCSSGNQSGTREVEILIRDDRNGDIRQC